MSDTKVFGIGFHKTGTTSLKAALERLGYQVAGKVGVYDPQIAGRVQERAFRELDRYDAFQDNPWPLLYRELDERCPGSKFILTVRSTEKWIESVVKHFGSHDTPMREWIYGVGHPLGYEDLYRCRYESHNAGVLAYFAGRPDDLLVFRTGEGDSWPELCGFLGLEVPDELFPHANSQQKREAKNARKRLRRGVRKRFRALRIRASRAARWW